MALEMSLWRVIGDNLVKVDSARLDREDRLEDWIQRDPSILGIQIAIIGRQVQTPSGGRIDLLGMDEVGNCVILELKRDRTPRDVVAQTLDYASWVAELGYSDLEALSQKHQERTLAAIFQGAFNSTIPETVNENHSMVVVASELDDSSERIISYLAERHDLSINAVFFRFFNDGATEHLGRCWLRDPVETAERSVSKMRAPWTGYWFFNVGEGVHRNWDDNVKYGYLGAGQGSIYSRPLLRLRIGDPVFAYMKGRGYVGYGIVASEAQQVKDFFVKSHARNLLDLPLQVSKASENRDSPELSEWAVAIDWRKSVSREDAKSFKGIFANQNIVCKIRDLKTIEFLSTEFGAAR